MSFRQFVHPFLLAADVEEVVAPLGVEDPKGKRLVRVLLRGG